MGSAPFVISIHTVYCLYYQIEGVPIPSKYTVRKGSVIPFKRAQNHEEWWRTEGGTGETAGNVPLCTECACIFATQLCTCSCLDLISCCFPCPSLSSPPFFMVLGSLERYYGALPDGILRWDRHSFDLIVQTIYCVYTDNKRRTLHLHR